MSSPSTRVRGANRTRATSHPLVGRFGILVSKKGKVKVAFRIEEVLPDVQLLVVQHYDLVSGEPYDALNTMATTALCACQLVEEPMWRAVLAGELGVMVNAGRPEVAS